MPTPHPKESRDDLPRRDLARAFGPRHKRENKAESGIYAVKQVTG